MSKEGEKKICIAYTHIVGTPISKNVSEVATEKVETIGEDKMEAQVTNETQSQICQIDSSALLAQVQGAIPSNELEKDKSKETELTPKPQELAVIQALVNLPKFGTSPTKILQKLSTKVVPLQISAPGSSSSKVDKVIHYGDITLDEEIVIPKYDYDTMTIEKIGILQQALEKKKHQEMLRKEYRKKQALQEIKDIFLDAFIFPTPKETKPLLEQLSKNVEKVNNEDIDASAKILKW